MIDLYFLIAAVNSQIFDPSAELTMLIDLIMLNWQQKQKEENDQVNLMPCIRFCASHSVKSLRDN